MIPGDPPAAFMPQRDATPDTIYDYYARFRNAGRVARGEPDWPIGEPSLALLRFDDVQASLRDHRLGKEWRKFASPEHPLDPPTPGSFDGVAYRFMLFRDSPDHTRLRSTANTAFTPRRVAAMREPVETLTSRLVDDLREQGDTVDLIAQFAYPLPVLIIAGILGVPSEDYPKFRDWTTVIAAAIDLPVTGLEAFVQRANETTAQLTEYFAWIVAQRRQDPRDDLISTLIAAETSEGRIDEQELIATIILLLVAGHETTVNLIGNGTLALLQHPDQWRRLVDDPSLARNATEELLRYDSPVQMTSRFAMEDCEIAGTPIRRGTTVFPVLGSANRDPDAFADPDVLDIRRDVGRIMSFGMGIHFCLGSPLARLEGELAFGSLARTFPDLRLATENPEWRPGMALHGLKELPVRLGT